MLHRKKLISMLSKSVANIRISSDFKTIITLFKVNFKEWLFKAQSRHSEHYDSRFLVYGLCPIAIYINVALRDIYIENISTNA